MTTLPPSLAARALELALDLAPRNDRTVNGAVRDLARAAYEAGWRAGAKAGWDAYETAADAMRTNRAPDHLRPLRILPEPPP